MSNKIIDFEKCAICCWNWEVPGIPTYCRLFEDVRECQYIPKDPKDSEENSN